MKLVSQEIFLEVNLQLKFICDKLISEIFSDCPNQEEFDSCADIEIDRIMVSRRIYDELIYFFEYK